MTIDIVLNGGEENIQAYWQNILTILGSSRVTLWPLGESLGTTVYDISGNSFNATNTGATVGQVGIGDGRTSYYFDGTNDYIAMPTTLNGVFNPAEGAMGAWVMADAACWVGEDDRVVLHIGQDASNRFLIYKAFANTLRFYVPTGGVDRLDRTYVSTVTTPLLLGLEWSVAGNYIRAIVNGVRVGADAAYPNAYVGGVASWRSIGSVNFNSASSVWLGRIQHAFTCNAPLGLPKWAQLARV
jgi:hypothetical protein